VFLAASGQEQKMPAHHSNSSSPQPAKLKGLFAAEETFRAIADVTQAGLYILEGTRFVYVNAAAEKLSGYTQDELLSMEFFDIIHPDFHLEVRERWQARQRGELAASHQEVKMVTKTGEARWAEYTLTPFTVAGKSFLLGTAHDITNRRIAQSEVQQSHELLRNLIDGMGPYMFVGLMTPDGIVLEANRPALEAAGLKLQDVRGKPVTDTFWFSYSEEVRQRLSAAIHRVASGEAVRYDEQIRVSSNQLAWIDFVLNPLKDQTGKMRYIIPSAVVITERKRAEEALRLHEERLRLAVEGAALGTWHWNMRTGELVWSDRCHAMFGLAPGTPMSYERFLAALHPEDRARADAAVQKALLERTEYNIEFRSLWPDGTVRWIVSKGRGYYDDAGQAVRMEGLALDVTERKRVEEERRQIFERVSDAFVALDTNWRYTFVNAKAAEIFGRRPEDLIGKHIWTEFPAGIGQKFHKAYERALAEQQPVFLEEYYPPYDRWFENRIYPSPEGLTIYFTDITERKRAEMLLREREQQLRLFVEHSPAAIAMFDRDMRYLVASRRWITDLRIADPNIIGRSHYEIFPEIPERWKEIHRRCLAGAVERCERDPFPRPDGTTDWVRWETRPWYTSQGQIGGLIIFAEIITGSVEAEQSLRELTGRLLGAQEEERGRIARELHDSLGQSLAAIAPALGQAAEVTASNPALASKWLEDARKTVAECSQQVRTLSHLLHPPLLDELGLAPAIRSFVRGFAERSGIATEFETDKELGRLPREFELALFRVLQECLTNVQRHSGSRTARVRLRADSRRTLLEVSDDGRGFRSDVKAESLLGIGILGMRERLRPLGGKLEIESGPLGTIVRAILPGEGINGR
jgi:PAS domain S-box-containing protein